jgi:hypothetical protein
VRPWALVWAGSFQFQFPSPARARFRARIHREGAKDTKTISWV